MKLKNLSLVAGIISLTVAAVPFAVKAQTTSHTPFQIAQATPHHGKFQKLGDELGLSPQQKQDIQKIQRDTHDQINQIIRQDQRDAFKNAIKNHQGRKAAREAMNLSQDQKDQIKAIMKSSREQMQAVLTPAQQTKLKQLRQQWRSEHPKHNS